MQRKRRYFTLTLSIGYITQCSIIPANAPAVMCTSTEDVGKLSYTSAFMFFKSRQRKFQSTGLKCCDRYAHAKHAFGTLADAEITDVDETTFIFCPSSCSWLKRIRKEGTLIPFEVTIRNHTR